jgi:hypothetical protein
MLSGSNPSTMLATTSGDETCEMEQEQQPVAFRANGPSGYKRQRVALAVIVLKLVALETVGSRSKGQLRRAVQIRSALDLELR